ncbi:DUF6255 family natural product biosynthesis protein [Streptomyces olivoreticuli]|uniref:DUF6255 family natural product biosynthesis protein n=1 Tax=Streptomyces olivoreticuli TaxID=68246 RepID=UPI003CC7E683
MSACLHRMGWAPARGAVRCEGCGVVRFTDYGALRPPGLPQAVTVSRGSALRADRTAAHWVARNAPRPKPWLRPEAGNLCPTVSQRLAPRH